MSTDAEHSAKVTITYCAECGYEPQTLSLTEALMKAFTHGLSAIELVPWYEGSFDVAVNGKLVHGMYRDGGIDRGHARGSSRSRRHVSGRRSGGACRVRLPGSGRLGSARAGGGARQP